MISIVSGNPELGPASFTKFVLPFAYKLTKKRTKGAAKCAYYPIDPLCSNQLWREKYFTEEIADALFRRVRWFQLRSADGTAVRQSFPIPISKKPEENVNPLVIQIDSPVLCLFEWPKSDMRKKANTSHDILRTGFLIVNIHFKALEGVEVPFKELLGLNELFRYWQQPFPGHEKGGYQDTLSSLSWKIGTSEKIGEQHDPLRLYFDRWACLLEDYEIVTGDKDGNWRLFPDQWKTEARQRIKEGTTGAGYGCKKPRVETEASWLVYADNRTFVWTSAVMDSAKPDMREELLDTPDPSHKRAWEIGHWVKLLNIDNPNDMDDRALSGTTEFERRWAEERTYKRWEAFGTYYGFCYHGGAMLGPDLTEPPLWRHFSQMYFDQALLLLYMRVTLFRFSVRLNQISSAAIDSNASGGNERWPERFQRLRWTFVLFANLYRFPLLSNQQQGIEMYAIMRESMDIDELFNEIDREIQSSHDYLTVRQASEQTKISTILTVVATVGLVFALPIAFMGMSWDFPPKNGIHPQFYDLIKSTFLWSVGGIIIVLIISSYLIGGIKLLGRLPNKVLSQIKRLFV